MIFPVNVKLPPGLEQAECGRAMQAAARETLDVRMKRWRDRGRVDEPPFSPFEAARGESRLAQGGGRGRGLSSWTPEARCCFCGEFRREASGLGRHDLQS